MNLSRVVYSRRFNLGEYRSEEITLEYTFEVGEETSATDVILKARDEVAKNSTAYLQEKARKEKGLNGEAHAK